MKKHLQPAAVEPLRKLSVRLESLIAWKAEAIHQCIHELCEELSLGMGKIAQPLRVAVTGGTTSPSIDITLELLGKKRTLARMGQCLRM